MKRTQFLIGLSLMIPAAALATVGPFFHERTDTPLLRKANVGRYIYLGVVPRFDAEDLELTISKLGLTLRVKADVSSQRIVDYPAFLLRRWKRIHAAFSQNPTLSFERIESIQGAIDQARTKEQQAWLTIASQYSRHSLENWGDIHDQSTTQDEYKTTISTALLRYFMQDESLSIEDGENLHSCLNHGVEFCNTRAFQHFLEQKLQTRVYDLAQGQQALANTLFQAHLGKNFTALPSPSKNRGYLTFVYPIAATIEGPFSDPAEGVRLLGPESWSTMEARWWSTPWKDEFGGFPFIQLTGGGIAFHGPITNRNDMDVWYLRRGFVSHGCHRMDASDILELRALLPADLPKFAGTRKGIKTVILEWPDVTDWNGDGKLEAMDVAYYQIPTWLEVKKGQSVDDVTARYMNPRQQKAFWESRFVTPMKQSRFWDGYFIKTEHNQRTGRTYHLEWKPHNTAAYGDAIRKNYRFDLEEGMFYGIPKYEVGEHSVKRVGYHDEGIPVHAFEYRPTSIIQYRESGIKLAPFDDNAGKFPPRYFNVQ